MEKKKKATRAHYIDNKEFLKQISEYRVTVLAAKEKGVEKPPVTGYLGECFIKIANHLAYKSNFINYTFRDEMILDGIENCLTYIDNFDPAKSSNPFAYFTQITYYAFLRRIQKEKRQMDTKMKYLQSVDLEGIIADAEGSGEGSNEFLDWMRAQLDITAMDNAKVEAHTSKNIPKRRPKYLDKKIADAEKEAKRSEEEEKALDIKSK